ncbi:MAG: DUF4389 domain-containing protein [Acidimicrobiia bacterium]|nr:DUF4389 domain-containing protein [Acidimicrobiia bacterium]
MSTTDQTPPAAGPPGPNAPGGPPRTGRVLALVAGAVFALPALLMLAGGLALLGAYAMARDDDGYFTASLDRVQSPTSAVTAEDIDLDLDPGTPGWVVDWLETDVRLKVTGIGSSGNVFVGIAPEDQVDAYLAGVAHDEITRIDDDRAVFRTQPGTGTADPPADQPFWETSTTGTGTQQLDWTTRSGRWAVVLMNADGSPGVAADVTAGVDGDVVLPPAWILVGLGAVGTAVAAALLLFGAIGLARHRPPAGPVTTAPADDWRAPTPVRLDATLDPGLSRGLWLVKWLLAIPHIVVLFFLWAAFAVTTIVAGFAILFTGRYPRPLFDFNLGVLRWNWRVNYYAGAGGLGTDRYPPFSLGPEPDYPARLDIAYPERLSRGLVLVKWWLLAIPHYLILGVLFGSTVGWLGDNRSANGGPGLLPILVFVAAVILLVTQRYPRPLFDLIVGFNRWQYRVIAYAALMTDQYPPFRLDQGGLEPAADTVAPNGPLPAAPQPA